MAKKAKKSVAKRETCLIIDWLELPQELQTHVADMHAFGNDVLLRYHTEFSMEDLVTGMPAVEDYYKNQMKDNGFKGTIEEFIDKYGLKMDIWIMEQKFDMNGIDRILIEVSW